MKDPLSHFEDLQDPRKDYPGSRPPRNRPAQGNSVTPPEYEGEHELLGKPRVLTIKGVPTEFFTIGALAAALERRPVTLRAWESEGVLPHAQFRTPPPQGEQVPGKAVKGQRLYTRRQAELVIAAVDRFKINVRSQADWKGFVAFLRKHWAE